MPQGPIVIEPVEELDLPNHTSYLTQLLNDLLSTTGTEGLIILATGHGLWRALSVIVVFWAGIRIAFSGASWAAWDIVRLLLTVSIPLAMLQNYNTDVIGFGMPFPRIIPAGANWVSSLFLAELPATMIAEFAELFDTTKNRVTSAWTDSINPLNLLQAGSSAVLTLFGTLIVLPAFTFILLGIWCFAYAQVVYALVVVALLTFLGPLFIPWLVFQPLSFLFWGWLRSLFVYSLYGAVAGILLRIWGSLALAYAEAFNQAPMSFADMGWATMWFLSIIPLAVAAILCSTKVGEIANSLVSGGGGGGMNVAGMATTGAMMATGGAGKIAAVAGKR